MCVYPFFLRLATATRRRSRRALERCHERFHQRDVRSFFPLPRVPHLDLISPSLRVDPALRPTPKEMLTHPWVVRIMKQDVPMERWIREVWGWPKPNRKSKDSYGQASLRTSSPRVDYVLTEPPRTSRPSSSRKETLPPDVPSSGTSSNGNGHADAR
jgi:serine/threonine protein kinase